MRIRAVDFVSWTLRSVAAVILVQTLYFKFTAAEESVYIFTTLGMEPWGRIASGVAELIAAALLLVPRGVVWGAGLAAGIMGGAIASHLTRLGIVVKDDGGLLFALALVVLACSAALLWLHRTDLPFIGRRFYRHAHRSGPPAHRVLVLGGGFGGIYVALALERMLERHPDVEVTLVNRENFFLFTPMLHEVAASDLDLTNIVSPIRKLLRRVDFFEGEVKAIDLGRSAFPCATARAGTGTSWNSTSSWSRSDRSPTSSISPGSPIER